MPLYSRILQTTRGTTSCVTVPYAILNISHVVGFYVQTVILDCCWQLPERATHTPNVRAICLPSHYGMPRDLDSDLYGRNDIILENLRLSSASHVLLVACSQYQQAYEINGRGAFTQVLTSFLRTVPIDTITYRDIIDNLQRLP